MTLIDKDALREKINGEDNKRNECLMYGWYSDMVDNFPTIDPETLPIVRELREENERLQTVCENWEKQWINEHKIRQNAEKKLKEFDEKLTKLNKVTEDMLKEREK